MNLALGMGLFKHSPGMTQEAFGQEFDWFYFSFSPSLSRKWSGTVTYKIMKDLFDLLQEMLGNWLGGKFLSRKWGSLEWPLTILEISMGIHTPHFTHCTLHTLHSTLLTPHFTLHTSHFTLHTPHSTLTLYTPHSTLSTPHCRLVTGQVFK